MIKESTHLHYFKVKKPPWLLHRPHFSTLGADKVTRFSCLNRAEYDRHFHVAVLKRSSGPPLLTGCKATKPSDGKRKCQRLYYMRGKSARRVQCRRKNVKKGNGRKGRWYGGIGRSSPKKTFSRCDPCNWGIDLDKFFSVLCKMALAFVSILWFSGWPHWVLNNFVHFAPWRGWSKNGTSWDKIYVGKNWKTAKIKN